MNFTARLNNLQKHHADLVNQKNTPAGIFNGVYQRYTTPVLTADHIPLHWRYDLNPQTNPFLQERLGVNAVFNPGAIIKDGKILLVARVEGNDRKSFFAIAESSSGIDGFRFWDTPLVMPETENLDTNVYDMRLVEHEDG